MRRKSSLAAAKKFASQLSDDTGLLISVNGVAKARNSGAQSDASASEHEPEAGDEGEDTPIEPPAKRQKKGSTKKKTTPSLDALFFASSTLTTHPDPTYPPRRSHSISYHRPLLLSGSDPKASRQALLRWFDSVSTTRQMPWRKAWIDPAGYDPTSLRKVLERRAYEVWISEIMLQQTRVAVVIDYWNRWMAKWPVIQDLANASPDDVLSAWRGLGYYSRATRIHQAAKLVVDDPVMKGLLPADVAELEKKVPGVGRYTAGAISAIVFGRAAPMVDGNVLRVLSRQLGLLGNVKSEKPVIDSLWAAADALAKAVANDSLDDGPSMDTEPLASDRPGRWGQALMELGSTICTPKPNCVQCPITATCRAYAEGNVLATGSKPRVRDIEEDCRLCHPLEEAGEQTDVAVAEDKTKPPARSKQATLAAFRFTRKSEAPTAGPSAEAMEVIANHAKKFPLKVVKKAVREEETIVCAIRHGNSFLIHRRPEKGLLAGLWEFPSVALPDADAKLAARSKLAKAHVADLVLPLKTHARYLGELGSVPWLFSHLKLTMHVHLFILDDECALPKPAATRRWATAGNVDDESMGTGMRKCWALIKDATD